MIDSAKAFVAKIVYDPKTLHASPKAFEIIKHYEGLAKLRGDGKVQSYLCCAGIPTIGWGSTKGIKLGLVITVDQALARFIDDVRVVEDDVRRMLKVHVKQSQFDALCSFVFNYGYTKASSSTLIKLINEGKTELAALEFRRWNKAMTVVDGVKAMRELGGLTKRRRVEMNCFLGIPYILD